MNDVRQISEAEIRDYLRNRGGAFMATIVKDFIAMECVEKWQDKEKIRGMIYRRLRTIYKYPGARRTMVDGRWFYELTE